MNFKVGDVVNPIGKYESQPKNQVLATKAPTKGWDWLTDKGFLYQDSDLSLVKSAETDTVVDMSVSNAIKNAIQMLKG